jgi:hypothetical protein
MERLDKHFEKLTKASFARYGFAYGELMARWPEVVGEALAQYCEPERIKWPRGSGENAQKLGGTLVIRAEPGRGLDLQYQTHQIIERINQFYGYGAITSIKIMQGHVITVKHLKNKNNSLDSNTEKMLETRLEAIADEKLKQALHRLGAGALAKRPGSSHEK